VADQPPPVRLPHTILRARDEAPAPPPVARPRRPPDPAYFVVGRRTDNELILFHTTDQESWIIYPPRSAYDFVAARRPTSEVTLVERHPWQPYTTPEYHPIDARSACHIHGATCPADAAIQVAARLGYDPFA
jgi:hypothetical protein